MPISGFSDWPMCSQALEVVLPSLFVCFYVKMLFFSKRRLTRLRSVAAEPHLFLCKQSEKTQSNFGCSRVRSLKQRRNIERVCFSGEFNVFLRQPRQRQRGQVVKCGSQNLTAVEAPGSILQTEYRLHRKQIFDPGAPLPSKHLLLQICLKLYPQKRAKVGPLFHPQQNVDAAELNKWRLST